jgi:hypothetical protein
LKLSHASKNLLTSDWDAATNFVLKRRLSNSSNIRNDRKTKHSNMEFIFLSHAKLHLTTSNAGKIKNNKIFIKPTAQKKTVANY